MTTYRERRERRAERLRDWADKREAKADTLHAANEPYRGDVAFNTQPGHIPERARAIARTERAWEHSRKAASMAARADTIERQLAGAIYSDDPDAVEALEVRIAALEAERDRIKRYNAACRKAGECTAEALAELDGDQRAELVRLARVGSVFMGKAGQFPRYHLENLSGNISRQRKRLEQLRLRAKLEQRDAGEG